MPLTDKGKKIRAAKKKGGKTKKKAIFAENMRKIAQKRKGRHRKRVSAGKV